MIGTGDSRSQPTDGKSRSIDRRDLGHLVPRIRSRLAYAPPTVKGLRMHDTSDWSDLAQLQTDVPEGQDQRLVRAAQSGLTFGSKHIADM
jgi:hypothetical protein